MNMRERQKNLTVQQRGVFPSGGNQYQSTIDVNSEM
jgi:hypothetical protein